MIKGLNYINGKWQPAQGKETFQSRSPAHTDQVIGVFPKSKREDVEAAVKAARAAYADWRALSRIKRGEYLDAFVQLAKAQTEELARLMAQEMGKALNECRADVTEGIHMAQFMAGRSRMPSGEVVASELPEKDAYMLRRPKGVVAAIAPFNFPFAIPLWLIAPSLLEGNTVVFKPAGDTAGVGFRLVELLVAAGLPPGVLNLVLGSGEEVGWPLVEHPEVDVILFVGSYAVGSRIKELAAKDYRKMAACEMGGKNGLIVFEDADLDLAASAAVLSAFKTAGQRCTSASRLIVQEGALKPFLARFLDLTKRLTIGDPTDERFFMGPVVNQAAQKRIVSYNDLARKEGAKVLVEGGALTGGGYDQGYFMKPFVYQMDWGPARVLHEEVFGPHVAVIPFRTVEEAIHIYNDTDYGLALSVITEDYRKARRVREECEFGLGYVNLPTIGAEVHLPFGGLKKSGTGMPSASTLIDVITHRVAWTVNHAREIKLAQGLSTKIG